MKRHFTRRDFLRVAGAGVGAVALGAVPWLGGCGQSPAMTTTLDGGVSDLAAPSDATSQDATPTPECRETDEDILGPYYRAGAPFRDDIAAGGMKGTRLALTGTVSGPGCQTPIVGALFDVWQADADAHYDNDGSINPLPPDLFILRGRFYSDGAGAYRLQTILPGRYLNGGQYRPAHIHVRLSADGYRPLTTQLYFEGDPFNGVDPWFKPSLAMRLADGSGGKESRFDFVLAPA